LAGDILGLPSGRAARRCARRSWCGRGRRISFGLVENLPVNGLTASELDALLTARLEQYLKKPRVDVLVKQFRASR
jgi:protein involved in polysaccharide export with SLBB domain